MGGFHPDKIYFGQFAAAHVNPETCQAPIEVGWPDRELNGYHRELVQPWRPAAADLLPPGAESVDLEQGIRVPAKWTVDLVATWLRHAMDTLKIMSGDIQAAPNAYRCGHPEVVRSAIDAYGYGMASSRPTLTPWDISQYDLCMPTWMLMLPDPVDRKIVAGIAMGLAFRRVGLTTKLSHVTVLDRHKSALERICNQLNLMGV